ncbi:hypothetical protein GH890_30300, partial [Bacillus thuringiensis]|nr:hypothetical protein [Bacillus thuringiensis]
MAGLLKKTTGLTGLAVLPNPHKNLMVVYDKILRTLKKMPADTAYRRHTEVIIQERLGHVKAEPNIAKLEARIQGGQIEEVLLQAEKELSLAR